MIRSLLTLLAACAGAVCLYSSAVAGSSPCGTYFQSSYRAAGKTKVNSTPNGGHYVLNDWNGDGHSDFWNFRWNAGTMQQDIVVYPALAQGNWNWEDPVVLTTPLPDNATTALFSGFSYTLLDHDLDGKTDMIVNGTGLGGQRTSTLYRNNGASLVFTTQTTWPADSDTSLTSYGYFDVTGDQVLDHVYVLVENAQHTLYYSPGNSDGSFDSPVTILSHTTENELNNSTRMIGDFDGDGDIDIAYSREAGLNERVRLLKNLGGGTFALGESMSTIPFADFPEGVTDMNNDGRVDFVADRGASFSLFYGQANGTFFESEMFPISNADASPFHPVDFNGDGRKDLIFVTDQNYEIHIRNGGDSITRQSYPANLPSGLDDHLHFEDFTADGKADLFDGDPDGKFFNAFREEVTMIRENVCEFKSAPRSANFDGDAWPDLVTWNPATGEWRNGNAIFNSSGTVAATSFAWGSGLHGDVPAPGDYDGDGSTDHTVYRHSDSTWYTYLKSTGLWVRVRFGLPGDIPVPGDYNGGGMTDYAVFRPSEGLWYIYFNEWAISTVVRWGSNGDRPVPADYDGDSKTDVAVFRPADGDWYFLRSTDSSYGIVHWGLNGDIPLPADYDGDRKADLTVYRAGVWYILRTSNGSIETLFWGTDGDIPVPVGQPGDIYLPTVYRPGNSRWYGYNRQFGESLLLSGQPVYFGLPNS